MLALPPIHNISDLTPIMTLIVGGLAFSAALAQASIAWRRHEAQTQSDRQRRITETFSKSVEQLGSDKLEVRLGGLYTLEQLNLEDSRFHWIVVELLCAFVRNRTTFKIDSDLESLVGAITTDVAVALDIIRRRPETGRIRENLEGLRLDLRGCDLPRANFQESHLDNALFANSRLSEANLSKAHLKGSVFRAAHLERANIEQADCQGASFREAKLEKAKLEYAQLSEAFFKDAHCERANFRRTVSLKSNFADADLRYAIFVGSQLNSAVFMRANLQNATFREADLSGANLNEADLGGASLFAAKLQRATFSKTNVAGVNFSGASVHGADLSGCTSLTQEQLDVTHGDWTTRMPPGIGTPTRWSQ